MTSVKPASPAVQRLNHINNCNAQIHIAEFDDRILLYLYTLAYARARNRIISKILLNNNNSFSASSKHNTQELCLKDTHHSYKNNSHKNNFHKSIEGTDRESLL